MHPGLQLDHPDCSSSVWLSQDGKGKGKTSSTSVSWARRWHPGCANHPMRWIVGSTFNTVSSVSSLRKKDTIGRRVQGRPRADRHKWSEVTFINGRKSMGFTTVVNVVTPANPRLPNTLWGGIWTPKSYPKDFVETWSGIRKTREMALFHLTYTMSPQNPWKIHVWAT